MYRFVVDRFSRNHKFYKLHPVGAKCYLLFGFQFVHTCTMVSYIHLYVHVHFIILLFYYVHVHVMLYTLLYTCTCPY